MVKAMSHYGSDSYEVASSRAAKACRTKMEGMIDKGLEEAEKFKDRVDNEVITDAMTYPGKVEFVPEMVSNWDEQNHSILGSVPNLTIRLPKLGDFGVHPHALGQYCERAGIKVPVDFARRLATLDPGLLAETLNRLYSQDRFPKGKQWLTRMVGRQIKGHLSDQYKRIDSKPTLEAFVNAGVELGLVPTESYGGPLKSSLKMLLPMVFEPAENEVICFGLNWQNSDFGVGAQSIRAFCMRVWCTNYCTTEECLREVHLGAKLDADSLSDETVKLYCEATASAIKDVVGSTLSPDRVKEYCAVIKQAHEEQVDVKGVLEGLKKRISKADLEAVSEAYRTPDITLLPSGNTKWRLSNAFSLIAQKKEDGLERLELEKEAGRLVPFGKKKVLAS